MTGVALRQPEDSKNFVVCVLLNFVFESYVWTRFLGVDCFQGLFQYLTCVMMMMTKVEVHRYWRPSVY